MFYRFQCESEATEEKSSWNVPPDRQEGGHQVVPAEGELVFIIKATGARCSSVVRAFAHGAMVVGSILHGVDPWSYFSFQPVLHDWCNKGRGMCYPVCGMVHIKEPLLLIGNGSLCGGSGFPLVI